MKYAWGIDLAEALNYCGIVIGAVSNVVRIPDLWKFHHIMYPTIKQLCTDTIAKKYPPTIISVDYSNNESFSEELEGHFNPAFLAVGSKWYGQWKMVNPIKFNMHTKLDMKQNSRKMHEAKLVLYPHPGNINPEKRGLYQELQEQLEREAFTDSPMGLKFPKPEGFDNDLAIAHELMLKGANQLLEGGMYDLPPPAGVGIDDTDYVTSVSETPQEQVRKNLQKRLKESGLPNASVDSVSWS